MNRILKSTVAALFAAMASFAEEEPATPAASEPPIDTRDPQRFIDRFQPFRTDTVALSPDGRHVAYSLREDETLSVIIIDLENPSEAKARVLIGDDASSTAALEINRREKTPARINWMGWVTSNRLVVEANRNYASYSGDNWVNRSGAILAFDADGGNARTLVTPHDVARTAEAPPAGTRPPAGVSGAGSLEPLLPTPDQPASTADALPQFEADDEDEAEDDLIDPFERETLSPEVFDYAPDDRQSLIVRTHSYPRFEIYTLDVVRGKLRLLRDEIGDAGMKAVLDRRGKPRLAVPATMRTRFPHRWGLDTNSFGRRWKPLDDIATFTDSAFRISPDNFFGERAIPIGFDENPDLLYFASNVGRDTFGIYCLDLKTGDKRGLEMDNAVLDLIDPTREGTAPAGVLVFDRFKRELVGVRYDATTRSASWLRPDLESLQRSLESRFPGRNLEILEWDESGDRFLIRSTGTADPGTYFIFSRTKGSLTQFVQAAPWLDEAACHRTAAFSFKNPAGGSLSGLVTLPRAARTKLIPVVVLLPDELWEPARLSFRREVQALADMGFIVLQVNPRGTWGFGLAHRTAIQSGGFDHVQIADILHVVDRIGKKVPADTGRVALLGSERGGYLALRALQLHPDRFRCAVAIEATPDIGGWLEESRWDDVVSAQLARGYFGDRERLREISILREPERITKPALFLSYPGEPGALHSGPYTDARRLFGALKKQGVPVEFDDLERDYVRRLPRARAAVFRRIEQFLNLTVYDYTVELGELKELPE